ncbi:shikimate dehydrogenase [Gordonia soli]|uniref:Shikimate dehydrogenase n=1 Tax=Gordonia soli NBRC 108243 TaxID=1223545 RepID=M0QK32_9ACTN|nr:shikimate dehydrogenase [Gordonia soli]GAC68809.1 shikimate dehydrogenase [Gordonia soli NBRC 108243]
MTESIRALAIPGPRKAAVLGSPISHSRSPDLHAAAYLALGLVGWTYERIECSAEELPGVVDGLDDIYVGLSVTMPGKLAALAHAARATERSRLVGSANTLVRTADGWVADCTDIDGMTGALDELGVEAATNPRAVVVGAGGTALPTVAALVDSGFTSIRVVARDAGRAQPVLDLADRLGVVASVTGFAPTLELAGAVADSGVVVSTVPATAAEPLIGALSAASHLVDVIYDPWPTPLAAAVSERGGGVVGGLVMLLNQAYRQVELFTGEPAPRAAMADVVGVR